MRRVALFVLAAGPLLVAQQTEGIVGALERGDSEEALEGIEESEAQLIRNADDAREVFAAIRAHQDGHGTKDLESSAKLAALALRIGNAAIGRAPEEVGARMVWAEAREVEAGVARLRRESDWIAMAKRAAADLAQWHASQEGDVSALLCAVGILERAASRDGAPADELMEQARSIVASDPRGASPASLPHVSYRVALCRVLVARGRKREAAEALSALGDVRDAIEDDEESAVAAAYNHAVVYARRNRLRTGLEFLMSTHVAAKLLIDLPVSAGWRFRGDQEGYTVWLEQLNADGSTRRLLHIFHTPPGTPGPRGEKRHPDPKRRVARWEGWSIRGLDEVKKQRKPRALKWSDHLSRGAVLEAQGFAGGGWQRRLALEANGKHEKGAHIAVLVTEHGEDSADDPDAAAVLASIREK